MHNTDPPNSRAWAGGVNMATADLATRVARVCIYVVRTRVGALYCVFRYTQSTSIDVQGPSH